MIGEGNSEQHVICLDNDVSSAQFRKKKQLSSICFIFFERETKSASLSFCLLG